MSSGNQLWRQVMELEERNNKLIMALRYIEQKTRKENYELIEDPSRLRPQLGSIHYTCTELLKAAGVDKGTFVVELMKDAGMALAALNAQKEDRSEEAIKERDGLLIAMETLRVLSGEADHKTHEELYRLQTNRGSQGLAAHALATARVYGNMKGGRNGD